MNKQCPKICSVVRLHHVSLPAWVIIQGNCQRELMNHSSVVWCGLKVQDDELSGGRHVCQPHVTLDNMLTYMYWTSAKVSVVSVAMATDALCSELIKEQRVEVGKMTSCWDFGILGTIRGGMINQTVSFLNHYDNEVNLNFLLILK